jgi:hypothetical protein
MANSMGIFSKAMADRLDLLDIDMDFVTTEQRDGPWWIIGS